jgi:uncharacterized membrane protein
MSFRVLLMTLCFFFGVTSSYSITSDSIPKDKNAIIDSLKNENYKLSQKNQEFNEALIKEKIKSANNRSSRFVLAMEIAIGTALLFFILWITYFILFMKCKKSKE